MDKVRSRGMGRINVGGAGSDCVFIKILSVDELQTVRFPFEIHHRREGGGSVDALKLDGISEGLSFFGLTKEKKTLFTHLLVKKFLLSFCLFFLFFLL